MQGNPDLWLLEFRARERELHANAATHRLARPRPLKQARNYRFRSATASALNSAAQLIAPSAM